MKKIYLSFILLICAAPAWASQTLVICGSEDPAGTTEVDNVNVVRGGNFINQLVIRNKNILNDFISKQALYPGELNQNGELVLENGLGGRRGFYRTLNNRYFTMEPEGQGYLLKVELVDSDGYSIVRTLAEFYYNGDCETFNH